MHFSRIIIYLRSIELDIHHKPDIYQKLRLPPSKLDEAPTSMHQQRTARHITGHSAYREFSRRSSRNCAGALSIHHPRNSDHETHLLVPSKDTKGSQRLPASLMIQAWIEHDVLGLKYVRCFNASGASYRLHRNTRRRSFCVHIQSEIRWDNPPQAFNLSSAITRHKTSESHCCNAT